MMNARAIKATLAKLGISQVQLAELAGYSAPYLSAVLNGARPASDLFRIRLAKAVPELWPLVEPLVEEVGGVLVMPLAPGVAIVQHDGDYWPVIRDWCPICRTTQRGLYCDHVHACRTVAPITRDNHPAMPDGDTIIELRARGMPGLPPPPPPHREVPCADCGRAVPVADHWDPDSPVWCLTCYNHHLGGNDG